MEAIQGISIAVSILTLCGFGVVASNFWNDRREKRKAQSQEAKARAKKEKQDEIREVIQEEISPVRESIDNIDKTLKDSTAGVVTLLRDRMKSSLNSCRKQGWASASDKANGNELYKTYKELGGNHFIEYVDTGKNEMNNLDSEEEYKAKHQKSQTKSTKNK